MVRILDCTTRDGGHETNWNFTDDFVYQLMNSLNQSGVSYYEIGYRNHYDNEGKGCFYNCTPEFLQKFYSAKGKLQLGVMTDTKRFSMEDFSGSENDFIDFVRIACHPDKIDETLNIAKEVHSKGYKVFVQLMDISNVDEQGYISLFKWKDKTILESLYFADSYGTLYPQDIEKYYNKLKILGYENLSFHGHDNVGMALQNSLKAVEMGAYSVDVTLDGIGRCGGNLNSKDLLEAIQ
ncbi:hypothetical protein HDR58_03185 [bacterium]|nr:hypothetical protein [bacterium]